MLRRFLNDERGSVLPVTVVLMTLLIVALAVLWDWSRVQIHWRSLQTASDAAALAGAMEGEQWDRVSVEKEREVCRTDANGKRQCWIERDTVELSGLNHVLYKNNGLNPGGWRRLAGCNIDGWRCRTPVLIGRWIEIDRNRAIRAAISAFNANVNAVDPAGLGGFAWKVVAIDVHDHVREPRTKIDPNEDVVTVRAQGTTTFQLLSMLGRAAQSYQRCSESRAEWDNDGRKYQSSNRC